MMSAALAAQVISVVICDDVPDMRRLLRAVLASDSRMTVVAEAANGREAVRSVNDLQPDVVLLDLAMPEMDGLEVIDVITSTAPRTGIVVLSGFDSEGIGQVALTSGADRYLEKGVNIERIIATVREVADSRRPPPTDADDRPSPQGLLASLRVRLGRLLDRAAPVPIPLAP